MTLAKELSLSPAAERKTIRISDKRQITIPQKFFETLGFDHEAECILSDDAIILRPLHPEPSGEFDEQILADLISQGLSGQELLDAFKETRRKIRPAVEAMLEEASKIARGEARGYSIAEVFGTEDIE